MGRTQTASIATKNKKGECILYLFTIMQDYNATLMACENVR